MRILTRGAVSARSIKSAITDETGKIASPARANTEPELYDTEEEII